MLVRLSSLAERLRSSLFLVPLLMVVAAVVLGLVAVEVDQALLERGRRVPVQLTATVGSARAVLGTIASATIAFAGVAFSISLLVIQLASSQYSPRVVPGLFRDPFAKRVMGVVIGTFAYCLVVLRSVQASDGGDGVEASVPYLAVLVASVAGIVALLAVVAFIDHAAHTMDVSRILDRATDQARTDLARLWPEDDPGAEADPPERGEALRVVLDEDGWVQRIDLAALARAAPDGGTVHLDLEVGRYGVAGSTMCWIEPALDDARAADARTAAREAVVVGAARTVEEDVGYGVRQLADVALRALSPGVNDPTTAQDALFHLGSVLREAFHRFPPPQVVELDGRSVVRAHRSDHAELVSLAFDEIRVAARGLPTVCTYLLEVLELLDGTLDHDDEGDDAPRLARRREAIREALHRQAAMVRADADRNDLGPHDVARIVRAHDDRFGSTPR